MNISTFTPGKLVLGSGTEGVTIIDANQALRRMLCYGTMQTLIVCGCHVFIFLFRKQMFL